MNLGDCDCQYKSQITGGAVKSKEDVRFCKERVNKSTLIISFDEKTIGLELAKNMGFFLSSTNIQLTTATSS